MKRCLLIASLLLAPWAAEADDFSYTFVEGGIASADVDVGSVNLDADGLVVRGSYAFSDQLFAIGSYEDRDFDLGLNGDLLMLGAGFHTGLSQDLDFVADLSYVRSHVGGNFARGTDSGYAIGAGIRSRVHERVEIDAGLRYVDVGNSDTVIAVSGRYFLNDAFSIGGALNDGDGGSKWSVLFRYTFGARRQQ